MSQDDKSSQTTTAKDVEQLGTFAAIASLSYVFWICGGMEMVERLAYYGVRQSTGLYITDSAASGGLGLLESDLGIVFVIWALVQTFVPVFTGGISDRVGYKETIFASTIFKIMGYLIMGFFPSFWGFTMGAIVLAFGTGIFKPGVQGTISKSTDRKNSSVAWGVFYQTVNIGGAIGPMIAVYLRQLSWDMLFFTCAAIISINFLLLLTYKEPDKEARLAHRAKVKSGEVKESNLALDSLKELKNPLLLWYILLFSGFWFMLNAFWDVAPLYFRDWVDTSAMVAQIFGEGGTQNKIWIFFWGMKEDGLSIDPIGLVNLNAIMIMLVCFLVAGLSAKIRAVNSMAIGTFLASAALLIYGGFNSAWIIVAGVVIFSLGEMLSSPKSLEFMANVAPREKKAMYLGFTQLPLGVGWITESYFGPYLYGAYSSKDMLARKVLAEGGMGQAEIDAIPVREAFDVLVATGSQTAEALTAQLYTANSVGTVWYVMGVVGIISGLGMYAYGKWVYRVVLAPEAESRAAD
jgi:proton-dependent oligopeptide transporter, POT family